MSKFRSARYENKRLSRIANHTKTGSVLDIGHAQHPNIWLNPKTTVGFDKNRANICDYCEQVQGDVKDILYHFHDRTFSTIIAAELIEHIENPYALLRELKEILEPEGRIILSTPNPVAFPTIFCEWFFSRRFFFSADHTYYFSPRWVERLLCGSGYEVCHIEPVGFWPFTIIPAPVTFSYQVIYVATPPR